MEQMDQSPGGGWHGGLPEECPMVSVDKLSFYMISSLAGDEDNYLVKIMIMVREFLSGLVFKMKKSELFVQVSCFFCLIELF